MKEKPMDIFEEMDEMFERIFSRMNREFSQGSPQIPGYRFVIRSDDDPGEIAGIPKALSRSPREPVAEVHRIGDETMVIIELPGSTDDAIRLDVKGSTLVIDAGDADNHYHTTASLPPVDAKSMQRSFKNGVLEVTFRNLP